MSKCDKAKFRDVIYIDNTIYWSLRGHSNACTWLIFKMQTANQLLTKWCINMQLSGSFLCAQVPHQWLLPWSRQI